VTGLSGVTLTTLVGGGSHSLALKTNQTVLAWGANGNGQLGINSTTDSASPVAVKDVGGSGTLGSLTALAGGNAHSLAVKANGTLFAWGLNSLGELGDNTATQRTAPV